MGVARAVADPFERSALRGALVSLVAIKIAGIILIVDVAGLQAFDLPKSLFSRALEWVMVGVIAAAALRYGVRILPRSPMHVPVVGVVLVTAGSALVAIDPYVALFGDWDRYLGLTFVVDMAVLYLAVACAYRRAGDWALLGAAIALSGALALAYALVQWLGLDPISWSDSAVPRPFSTLGNADHFGHVLSGLFGLAAALAAFGRQIALRAAAALGAAAVLAVGGLVATRGTFLALVAVLAVVAAGPLIARGATRGAWMRFALAVVAGGGVLAATLAYTPLGARMLDTGFRDTARLLLYEGALRAALDRPILGYGPDTLAISFAEHTPERYVEVLGNESPNAAHDWILQTAATTGAAGLAAMVAAIAVAAALAARALRRRQAGPFVLFAGSAGYWTHALVSVGSISVDWLPWLAFGGIAAMTGTRVVTTRRPARSISLTAAFAIAATIVAAISGVDALQADHDAWLATHIAAERALGPALSATRHDPGRAEYQRILAEAALAADRYELALSAAIDAADRDRSGQLDELVKRAAARASCTDDVRIRLGALTRERGSATLREALYFVCGPQAWAWPVTERWAWIVGAPWGHAF